MNDNDDDRIWQGLRGHLDELGRIAPSPDIAGVRERSERQGLQPARVLLPLGGTAILAVVAVFVAGQVGLLSRSAAPGSSSPAATDAVHGDAQASDAERREAQAALDRWAQAVASAPSNSVVITGDLTGQIGDWEPAVGDNNKMAVMSGAIVASSGLPKTAPPPGQVQWSDGTSKTVPLLSADAALNQIIASAGSKCPECRPVEVTTATLGTASVQTSHGSATVPVWEFSIAGSAVKITQVAVAAQITVTPPIWDPSNAPVGISIDGAVGTPQSRELTVSFGGAPLDETGQCGADYTAEAVESDLAIVVIVTAHPHPAAPNPSGLSFGCRLVAALRTATVNLAAPLGDRAVLEVREGLPVPVTAP
jgi:hypothetical protein